MTWKRMLIPASAIPVLALLAYGLTRDPNRIESPLPGRQAFDFAAPTLEGDTLRLSDLGGRVVILNFWASWCLACIDEHAYLVEASRRYPESEVQVLGVVYQDRPENARRWMSRMGGDWPSVIDRSSRIAIDYGVYGVPETYFIGKDGRIAYKQIGPVDGELLTTWIERLRSGTVPSDDPRRAGGAGGDVPVGRSSGHERAVPGTTRGFPESERTRTDGSR